MQASDILTSGDRGAPRCTGTRSAPIARARGLGVEAPVRQRTGAPPNTPSPTPAERVTS